MTEYKSIREWIAEGVNPVGYVTKAGLPLTYVDFREEGFTVLFSCQGHDFKSDLDHLVAPPAPKRMSDEELLNRFDYESWKTGYPEKGADAADHRKRASELRTQILERMKAKGPTRGEVEKALDELLVSHKRWVTYWSLAKDYAFQGGKTTFLSMFPEGEE